MTQFLASIGFDRWILHVLLVLPLVGVIPVLFGPVRLARRTALFVTCSNSSSRRDSGGR
jgi:hypothetical protein